MTKCLYICGAGHSGSTLLDMLLGSHSRVASLGEIINLPMDWATNNRCTCGASIRECALWSKVVPAMAARLGIDMNAHPYACNLGPIYAVVGDRRVTGRAYQLRRKLVAGLHYLELRAGLFGALEFVLPTVYRGLDNNLALFDLVARELGVDYVVDSSKVYPKAIGLYKRAPGKVKIILLIRDGRAVYYSMRTRGFDRQTSLNAWYKLIRRTLPMVDQHVAASDVLTVKYEELASDPPAQMRRICDFVGLAFEPGMLNFRSKVHHNVNGNDMRLATASEIRPDSSWREKLADEEKDYFMQHAGWLNRKLGYA